LLLKHSRLMQCVACIVVLSNIAESGVIELFLIYLNDVVNFTALDNAYVLLVVTVLSLFVQTAALRWLLLFGERVLITLGLCSNAVHLLLYCMVGITRQKWLVDVLCIFSAFTFLPMTAISSMVSHNAPAQEQGLHLGTLSALRALSTVIGPAIFTPLYVHFRGPPFNIPEAPFYGGALMVLCAILVAKFWLPKVLRGMIPGKLPPSTLAVFQTQSSRASRGRSQASGGQRQRGVVDPRQRSTTAPGRTYNADRRSTKILRDLVKTAQKTLSSADGADLRWGASGAFSSEVDGRGESSSVAGTADSLAIRATSPCTPENLRRLSVRRESSNELRAERIARLLQTTGE
jgi:hypothetical protein